MTPYFDDDDGDYEESGVSPSISYTFQSIGTKEVTLRVSDDAGNTDTDTVEVTVEDTTEPVAEPQTNVSLSPESSEISSGQTQTYDVVVGSADGGVGAYNTTVSLENVSVASITNVSFAGSPELINVSYAADNSSVTVSAALSDTTDTGRVSIASITVEAEDAGSSELSVYTRSLGTENGTSYNITTQNTASISVTTLRPVGEFRQPPTDPDGDNLYEDINGDGEANIVDVQALFGNLDDDTIQNNPEAFDYNSDGQVDVVDVQRLFNEL